MEISKHIREHAIKITTKEQFFWKAYAKAFEVCLKHFFILVC